MAAYVIGGEKGGTGKSTKTMNLATMLSLCGIPNIAVDCDKQRTTHKYKELRYEKGLKPDINCVLLRGKNLHSEIDELARYYRYVLIDCGGQDSVELRSALVASSVENFYAPLQPSSCDLETIDTLIDLTEHSQIYNPKLKTTIIINRAPTNTKINTARDAIKLLREFAVIKPASTILCDRIAYQYAKTNALSVVEYEFNKIKEMPTYQSESYLPKASFEMCALFKEIFGFEFPYKDIFGVSLIGNKLQEKEVST